MGRLTAPGTDLLGLLLGNICQQYLRFFGFKEEGKEGGRGSVEIHRTEAIDAVILRTARGAV